MGFHEEAKRLVRQRERERVELERQKAAAETAEEARRKAPYLERVNRHVLVRKPDRRH